MSNVVEKIKDKVENILHKDHDHTHTTTTTTGAHHGTHAHGTHNTTGGALGGSASTNAGPHDSNLANKADPRVDSDRDGSRNLGAASYGPGGAHTGTGVTGAGCSTSTNAGPHDSNVANKLDPRVDSDRDGSRNLGAASYGPGGNRTGGVTGTGVTGAGYSSSTNAGPHDSNVANKLDPRVDSDMDGSRNLGLAKHGAGATHNASTGPAYNTAGPHTSDIANKVDPRVDSDADGSRNLGAASYGPGGAAASGPASGSAGPHGSNLANKLDPRVDSDADGSRNLGAASYGPGGAQNTTGNYGANTGGTFGGNTTY